MGYDVIPPEGAMRLADLARALRDLNDALVRQAADQCAPNGTVPACARGCTACCRQLVTVAPAEAWLIAELIATWPTPTRTGVQERCAAIEARLADAGLMDRLLRLDDPALSHEDHYTLAREYFGRDLPCPLLAENGDCLLYAERPAACREYLVHTAPAWCADPFAREVGVVPLRARVSEALTALCAQLLRTEAHPIPLPLAPRWAREHEAWNQKTWPARTLINRFLLHLEVVIGSYVP
jgi:hypothetical protein